jgi:hypothetical protein
MEDPRTDDQKHEPLDVEAAILSRETAESLEKIFNVLMKLNLAGVDKNPDGQGEAQEGQENDPGQLEESPGKKFFDESPKKTQIFRRTKCGLNNRQL